jgi:hypothetical protein
MIKKNQYIYLLLRMIYREMNSNNNNTLLIVFAVIAGVVMATVAVLPIIPQAHTLIIILKGNNNSSTGVQRSTIVAAETIDVSLKSQRPLPSARIPVSVTYSGAAAGQPISSHFNAKEQLTTIQIPGPGHYDVSVSFSYLLPNVHPRYIGDCRGNIKAGDHLNCIIDPYGHAASTTRQSTNTTTTNTTRVRSQITATATNPVTHNATLTGGSGCSNVATLWNHVYGVPGDGKEQWNRPSPAHPKTPSRLLDSPPPYGSCVTVTGIVESIYDKSQPTKGTHNDPDGDLHFTLMLLDHTQYSKGDPTGCPSKSLTNCHNIIVEAICHTTPTGIYAKTGTWGDYCSGVTSLADSVYPHSQFPSQGDKLSVSGRLVFDNGKEQWNEIHPASDIHKIS